MRYRILLFLSLLISTSAWAHPYIPLRKGDVVMLDYKFRVDTTKQEFKAGDTHGKMINTCIGEEQKVGKSWYRFTTTYEGIRYMTEPAHSWRREENGNIYQGSDLRGQFNETLELPKDVSVGSEWEYYDGEKSKRKVTAKLEMELGDGEKVSDCIEVTRTVLDNKKLSNVTNKDYYCPEIGHVKYLFRQPSPFGDYITQTSLLSFKPGT